jgi:hypothetical protein
MVLVAVGDEDKIGGHGIEINAGGQRVGGDEGIEEQRATAQFNRETGVTVVGDLHKFLAEV